jgi:hypothetical protein
MRLHLDARNLLPANGELLRSNLSGVRARHPTQRNACVSQRPNSFSPVSMLAVIVYEQKHFTGYQIQRPARHWHKYTVGNAGG